MAAMKYVRVENERKNVLLNSKFPRELINFRTAIMLVPP